MIADLDLDIAELDAEVARMRAKFPKIFNVPPPLPHSDIEVSTSPANEREKGFIYVNSITADGS